MHSILPVMRENAKRIRDEVVEYSQGTLSREEFWNRLMRYEVEWPREIATRMKAAQTEALRVNRPQQTCGTRPCWKIAGGTSYKYADKLLAADGMLTLQVKSGAAGTGKFTAKGKNNLAKGQTALPTGVAAQLTGNRHATVQLMSSNAGCLTGTVDDVHDATPTLFKGTTP